MDDGMESIAQHPAFCFVPRLKVLLAVELVENPQSWTLLQYGASSDVRAQIPQLPFPSFIN